MGDKNQELIEKERIFNQIWELYQNEVEYVLAKSGVPKGRMPSFMKLYSAVPDIHLNKIKHGEEWLKKFIITHIGAWSKIRAENSEQYWEDAEKMGWGNEFTEIRCLKEAAKKIRTDWFTSHNVLILQKKERKNAGENKGTENPGT